MITEHPEYFSLESAYAAYRPEGEFTFDEAVEMIDAAIAHCIDTDIRALLVDITNVTGFPPPSTIQRFAFASRWAATARGRVRLSMLAPPEMIDPEKLGVTVAANRGLRSDVFTSEADAVEWLLRTSGESSSIGADR